MSVIPATRLLWAVFAAAMIGAAAGPWPALLAAWLAVLGGVVVTALGDLALSLTGVRPPVASVPPVVRLTKDRPGMLAVTLTQDPPRAGTIRFALGLPATMDSAAEELLVALPGDAPRVRLEWACTARRRGRWSRLLACTESDSRLGLWRLRWRAELACDLRVYPNLFSERRQLAALFLAGSRDGTRVRQLVGRGREFEKLRDYQPGDGFDEIHWKATAKRGRPVTKVFQTERTQEIYVVLDSSRLSGRPVVHDGVRQTSLERCLTATFVLMLAALRQGDRFGLVAYDDRVRLFLRAGQGSGHYAACREAALALQPSTATPDMAEIVRHLHTQLRRRALVFFLTDLTDPVLAEDFVAHVRVLSRRHLVLVGQLRAEEVAPLFQGPEVTDEKEIYQRLAGHERWEQNRGLAGRLRPLGVTSTLLENETLAAQLVTQYMQVKRRQVL